MVNARNTRGEKDTLLVDDLLAKFPEDAKAFMALRKRVMENPLYRNQLISVDGTFTSMVVESLVYSDTGNEMDLLSGFDEPDAGNGDTAPPQIYHRQRKRRDGHRDKGTYPAL